MKWICVYKVPIYLPWLVICYKVKTWIALILQRCCYGYANATFHHLWADTESHILVCEQKCQVSPPFPNPLISIFNFSTIPLFHWFHIAGDGQLSVENTYTEHVCGLGQVLPTLPPHGKYNVKSWRLWRAMVSRRKWVKKLNGVLIKKCLLVRQWFYLKLNF